MATLQTLGVDNLSLRGAGSEYNSLSRAFKTKAEADAALASGDWTPVAGRMNLCVTGDQGVLRVDENGALVTADDATRAYIDAEVARLVGDAPAVLDSLGELSDAMADDPNFFSTMASANTTLQEAITAETSRATTAEDAIQADVDQNEADADAADAALGVRIDAVEAEIDTARTNIYTALGQAASATDMGTFTGSTLGDGQTVKQLLQSLETATETEISDRQAAIADILDGATFTGDIVLGTLARLKESGNELKIQNDAQSSSIVLGPKISLQPATGSRIELFEKVRMPDGNDLVATGAELNWVQGVTSPIQDQLNAIQSDVDQNESDVDAAAAALSGRLDVLEADPTTETALATERARIDAILAGADADKDTFAEIVTLINSVDTENDNAFAGYVTSNDAALATERGRIDAVETEIDTARTNIYTALGQAEGATAMGTFTGSTLGDGQTVKQLLQALETATETEISDRQAAIADILDGATFTGDILFGTLARLQESGNEFKIRNDAESASIIVGPKISLQPATGSRIELFETVRMPDGTDLTVTGAELNFVDGVTSNIQTQLDAIQSDVDQNESDADAAIALKLDASAVSAFGLTLVDDADAATARTTLGLGSAATTDSGDYATAAQGATADAALPAAGAQAALSVDHLITLSGVAEAADDLGTFTGATINDNVTVKAALQALETAQEATQADVDQNESDADAAIAAILAGTSIPGTYNNDTEAAAGGVAVGAIYKNSNGTIHWRVS